jgi:hypothetical protein
MGDSPQFESTPLEGSVLANSDGKIISKMQAEIASLRSRLERAEKFIASCTDPDIFSDGGKHYAIFDRISKDDDEFLEAVRSAHSASGEGEEEG